MYENTNQTTIPFTNRTPVLGPIGPKGLMSSAARPSFAPPPPPPIYDTPDMAPKELETYIHDHGIIGQNAAVKAAALILYRHFTMRIASVSLFCGPTGCGKTQIWRILANEFPQIHIFDSSNLTSEGWRGSNKISYHFRSIRPQCREQSILVFDEFDKLLEPKSSNDTNYTEMIQNDLLKLFDHDILYFGPENNNDQPLTVDCKNVSIVLLGAFENLLKAKSVHKVAVGFGAQPRQKNLSYADTQIITDDLLHFTKIRPEIAGRIDRVVSMNPLTETDHYRILLRYIDDLSKRTGTNFTIDPTVLQSIAQNAIHKTLGARWAIHQVNHIIDKMIYENPFENNYVYTIDDERTGDLT